MVLLIGLYSREQSSPLYIVHTVGKAVEVSYSAIGKTAMVKLGLATSRVAKVYLFSYRQSSKS